MALRTAFYRVEQATAVGVWDERDLALVDLAEEEAVNSVRLAKTLLGEPAEQEAEDTSLTDELSSLSPELDDRWRGALYALNPRNPDAARHFCASAPEVIIQTIDLHAPDGAVQAASPNCEMKNGQVARREKIRYLLDRYGTNHDTLGDVVDEDVNDVMKLFSIFNKGTHGTAERFDIRRFGRSRRASRVPYGSCRPSSRVRDAAAARSWRRCDARPPRPYDAGVSGYARLPIPGLPTRPGGCEPRALGRAYWAIRRPKAKRAPGTGWTRS